MATGLARSQRKADSSLLNFSRWRIKQTVADCPQAEQAGWAQAARLPWGRLPAPALPVHSLPVAACPLSLGDAERLWPEMLVVLPRYVGCRLDSSP